MEYIIREMKPSEYPQLDEFLYNAIFQRDSENLLPKSVTKQPELLVYIKDFGRTDDHCLVAECGQKLVGAVWTRILSGEVKGFGNIDESTPEFAISLIEGYRNKGIGTALMKAMINLLTKKGYKQTSLAVQKDNYAVRMYKAIGFSIVDENDEEYIMVYNLQ